MSATTSEIGGQNDANDPNATSSHLGLGAISTRDRPQRGSLSSIAQKAKPEPVEANSGSADSEAATARYVSPTAVNPIGRREPWI